MLTIDKLIIPLASSMVGLIPVLINLTVNWLDKRSHRAQRDAEIQYANQRVMFLTSWFNLEKEITETEQLKRVRDMVSDELSDMYQEYIHATLEVEQEAQKRQELIQRVKSMNFIKRLFLLYTPYNVRGWFYHTLFYMCVMPLAAVLGFVGYHYIQTQTWLTDVPQEYLFAGAGAAILAIIFHWLGRAAAKDVEGRMATLDKKTSPLIKSV
jgi:hypothetical protein